MSKPDHAALIARIMASLPDAERGHAVDTVTALLREAAEALAPTPPGAEIVEASVSGDGQHFVSVRINSSTVTVGRCLREGCRNGRIDEPGANTNFCARHQPQLTANP